MQRFPNTRVSKIFVRADGKRVRVTVTIRGTFSWEIWYDFEVDYVQKGKRRWMSAVNHDDYSWRHLDQDQRRVEDRRRMLLHATEEELREVALLAREGIKP